jgi:hypothetical protein
VATEANVSATTAIIRAAAWLRVRPRAVVPALVERRPCVGPDHVGRPGPAAPTNGTCAERATASGIGLAGPQKRVSTLRRQLLRAAEIQNRAVLSQTFVVIE